MIRALGGASLVFFPHKFAVPRWLQVANIVVSPVSWEPPWCGLGDCERIEISRQYFFICFGFVLALLFVLVRFSFAT